MICFTHAVTSVSPAQARIQSHVVWNGTRLLKVGTKVPCHGRRWYGRVPLASPYLDTRTAFPNLGPGRGFELTGRQSVRYAQ